MINFEISDNLLRNEAVVHVWLLVKIQSCTVSQKNWQNLLLKIISQAIILFHQRNVGASLSTATKQVMKFSTKCTVIENTRAPGHFKRPF